MQFSANTRYAVRLLFELKEPGMVQSSAVLAEKIGIPLKTLEKIHLVLKKEKITDSIIGAKGGIFLCLPLTEVSLGTMVRLFDNGVRFAVCYGEKANECPMQHGCKIRSVWRRISGLVQEQLNGISLREILQGFPQYSCYFEDKGNNTFSSLQELKLNNRKINTEKCEHTQQDT